MAVKLIANYSKRLGLPGYSSHQFSVSVETELINVDDVAGESERLYSLLQNSVDEQIQKTGFVPPDGYGVKPASGLIDELLERHGNRRQARRPYRRERTPARGGRA